MGHAAIGPIGARAAVAIPVAAYILGLWVVHYLPRGIPGRSPLLGPSAAALVLITPLTRHAVLLIGLVLAALVAAKVVVRTREVVPRATTS
jgi:hypothetical protein